MSRKILRSFVYLFIFLFLPLSVFLVGQNTHFLNKAYLDIAGKEANLVIDLSKKGEVFRENWRYFSQGGESSGGMLSHSVSSMKKIGPRYIRIDHVYDFYEPVTRNSEGRLVYNWQRLDLEIRAIRDMGAKPFISLSYMPPAISSGSEVDVPRNWVEWEEVVRATIEHISGKNELAIEGVYYEVWNEPDLFGDFNLKGEKSYLNLYLYASRGAQSAKNVLAFKFGGPATTALYKSWVYDLISFVERMGLRMDFYSWHRYSLYLRDYESDLENLSLWGNDLSRLRSLELVVTEFGHTPKNDDGYDNYFSAIHTIAVIAENFGHVDKMFTFEVIDGEGDKKHWGRWGILTNPKWGVPEEKPRFKAFGFLNDIDVPGIAIDIAGEGDFVKAIGILGGDGITILIVNYDPSGRHYENVPINVYGLPDGEYTYRLTEFFGKSLDFPVLIRDGKWNSKLLMRPNTAVILKLLQ